MSIIIKLPVQSLPKSISQYCNQLGFELEWEDDLNGTNVASIQLNGSSLVLFESSEGNQGFRGELVFVVEDVKQFREERSFSVANQATETMSVDGYLQFSINDIDGYRLTFAEVQNEIAEPDPEFDAIVLDMDELASERSTFVPDSFSDNRFTDGPYTH